MACLYCPHRERNAYPMNPLCVQLKNHLRQLQKRKRRAVQVMYNTRLMRAHCPWIYDQRHAYFMIIGMSCKSS
jgi:hypothetical protein